MNGVEIDILAGQCPVEAEGRIDGKPFYFRARGQRWSLSIGGDDIIGKPDWHHEEPWGDTRFAAGWMEEAEALRLIEAGAGRYWAEKAG